MTIMLKKGLKYRYAYYANIIILYMAITYFFRYTISLGGMFFILIIFTLLSEGIIRNHDKNELLLLKSRPIPLVFYPLMALMFIVIFINISNSQIYTMEFNPDKNNLKTIKGKVVKDYNDSHYVDIIDDRDERKKFVFDYPSTALDERDIPIPEGEYIHIDYLTTNITTPAKEGFYLLAYDIRSDNKVYLEKLSSYNRYSKIRSSAIRNILISILGYVIVGLLNYFIYLNYLKKGLRHVN